MYPRVNQVHPQIRMGSQPHFGARDPMTRKMIEMDQLDKARGRLEGLYIASGGEYNPYEH
jgi:hypothetical protein